MSLSGEGFRRACDRRKRLNERANVLFSELGLWDIKIYPIFAA